MTDKEINNHVESFCERYNKRQEERVREEVDLIIKEEKDKLPFLKYYFAKVNIINAQGKEDKYSDGYHAIFINGQFKKEYLISC